MKRMLKRFASLFSTLITIAVGISAGGLDAQITVNGSHSPSYPGGVQWNTNNLQLGSSGEGGFLEVDGYFVNNTGTADIGFGNTTTSTVLLANQARFDSDGINVGTWHSYSSGRIDVESGSGLYADSIFLGGGGVQTGTLNVDGDVEVMIPVDENSYEIEFVPSTARFDGHISVGGNDNFPGSSGGTGVLSVMSGGEVSGTSMTVGLGYLEEFNPEFGQSFTSSFGSVNVMAPSLLSGASPQLSLSGQLDVGVGGGSGTLNVLEGGIVKSLDSRIGYSNGPTDGGGSVNISGMGSKWINLNATEVGVDGGVGSVAVSDHGHLSTNGLSVSSSSNVKVQSGGSVTAADTLIDGDSFEVSGTSASGIPSSFSTATLEFGTNGGFLRVGGGGQVNVESPVATPPTGSATGTLLVTGGEVRVPDIENLIVDMSGGRLETVAFPTRGFSHDAGTLSVELGGQSSSAFLGFYNQGTSGVLELTLDQDDVTNGGIFGPALFVVESYLDGRIDIQLAEGFQPTIGDRFTLMQSVSDFENGLLGLSFTEQFEIKFENAVLPAGSAWEIDIFEAGDGPEQTLEYIDIFVVEAPIKVGDFNIDGVVDEKDIDFYSGNLDQPTNTDTAQLDLNSDDQITLVDRDIHVTTLVETSNGQVGTLIGDINLDGTVDVLGDAFILVSNLNSSGSVGHADGDLNSDGQVDVLGDAFRLVGTLGQSNTSLATNVTAVPEPGVGGLLLFFTSGLFTFRQRCI